MKTRIYDIETYDYPLDEKLVAKYPLKRRELAKLLVVRRNTNELEHAIFKDIVDYLDRGDVLVINDSKVVKARLIGNLDGKEVEILFTRAIDSRTFEAIGKPLRRMKVGKRIRVGDYILLVKEALPQKRIFYLENHEDVMDVLDEHGKIPLPHYIDREPTREDEIYYQTVYATKEGSIASPTAGLHFTKELLNELSNKGVRILRITLHVGIGTFKPIKVRDIREHELDPEYYEIPEETALEIERAKREGRRIFAVGTTSVRTLEYWNFGEKPLRGWTNLFIHPPYSFKVVDALITNFHLPRSTPFILVCAFIGDIERTKEIYKVAMENNYRFYSYGDAMLIL